MYSDVVWINVATFTVQYCSVTVMNLFTLIHLPQTPPNRYSPPNPYQTASYYPQEPHPAFEQPDTFANFDPDTLFFIFYYQQNSYQQYLAAKELKKKSWRFHKRYQTWFQRADPPIYVNEEYGHSHLTVTTHFVTFTFTHLASRISHRCVFQNLEVQEAHASENFFCFPVPAFLSRVHCHFHLGLAPCMGQRRCQQELPFVLYIIPPPPPPPHHPQLRAGQLRVLRLRRRVEHASQEQLHLQIFVP